MTYYERLKRKRLSDILVDEGVASKEAVITALHEHQQGNQLLSHVLIRGGELREYDLVRVLVAQYQLPFLDLVNHSYHRDLIERFPGRLLSENRVIPLDSYGEVTSFVCQEFPSDAVFEELATLGVHRVFLFVALATDIRQALDGHVEVDDEGATEDAVQARAVEMAADRTWTELFDTANEAIVTGMSETPDDDPEADESLSPAPAVTEPDALPDFLGQD